MVAGRERCHEEATRTAPCRPNPTDPGDAADLSIPQGYPGIRKIFSRDFIASPALTPQESLVGTAVHHPQRLTEPQPKSTAKDHAVYADRPSTTKIVITSPDRHYHGPSPRRAASTGFPRIGERSR